MIFHIYHVPILKFIASTGLEMKTITLAMYTYCKSVYNYPKIDTNFIYTIVCVNILSLVCTRDIPVFFDF